MFGKYPFCGLVESNRFLLFIKYLPGWMSVDRAEEEITRSVTTKLINYNIVI